MRSHHKRHRVVGTKKKMSASVVVVALGAGAATTTLASLVLLQRSRTRRPMSESSATGARGGRRRDEDGASSSERDADDVAAEEDAYRLPATVGAPPRSPYEKPAPATTREWRAGASWTGSWRAASEPGDKYMAGPPIEARRVPAFAGTIAEARKAGFATTNSGDSVSVDPVLTNCTDVDAMIASASRYDEGGFSQQSYPRAYPVADIVANWPPDTISVPPRHFASLCKFDYGDVSQREAARRLRDSELPFLVFNVPEADSVAARWSTPGFLETRLGEAKKYRTERSDDNHFMYYAGGGGGAQGTSRLRGGGGMNLADWRPPTRDVAMTFPEWLDHARRAYNATVLDAHYYFRLSPPDVTTDDVPLFKVPRRGQPDSLFLADPAASKGVHCRFGAAGVVAEAHYDGSRNFVAELGGPPDHPNAGRRRYVLAAPHQCDRAYLLPRGHPSGRHSQIDWSRPVDLDKFPDFPKLAAFETVLEPGDVLYIPHFWLHYIVSLGTNYQCNARSGRNNIGTDALRKCGFL